MIDFVSYLVLLIWDLLAKWRHERDNKKWVEHLNMRRYEMGMKHLNMRRYDSAIKQFDSLLDDSVPLQAQAYIGRGRAMTALGNPDLALKDFDTALKLNSEPEIVQQANHYRGIAEKACR